MRKENRCRVFIGRKRIKESFSRGNWAGFCSKNSDCQFEKILRSVDFSFRSEVDPLSNLGRLDVPDRILEGLYLGSLEAARNWNALKARNISHVLTVGRGLVQPFKGV